MDKWNWAAIGIVSGFILTVGGWLNIMITNIRKDIKDAGKSIDTTTKALELHVVEDKAVACDVRDLKSKVEKIEDRIHHIDISTAETNLIVKQIAVNHGLLPTKEPQ